ncbi:right-handed parallel beta-helix repeat-containing protein [Planctomycetota bacterium]
MNRLAVGCIASLFVLFSYAAAKDISVTQYGAMPDDGKDDAAALHQAVDACGQGDRLVFPRGTYDLFASFEIENKTGLDVEGNGSTLLLRGFDRTRGWPVFSAIRLRSSKHVTIHDFVVDMDVSPNSAGEIVGVGDRYFDVRVFDEFPVTGEEYVDHVMTFYRNGLPNGKNMDLYKLDGGLLVEKVADQVLRIGMHRRFDLQKGEYVCLYHKVYGGVCIYFGDCDLCTLRDVTVHSFPGMGFYSTDRSTNITVERYCVKRPKGTTRLTSTNADGSKYVHTGGMLTIKDCYYEGMGDDAINIHSSYGKVVKRDGKTLSITRIRRGKEVDVSARYVLQGDTVEFYDGKTMVPKGSAKILERDGQSMTLDVVPNRVAVGDLFNNISMTPKVRISGVEVHRNRARGFLLQSQDVIVEKCKILNPTGIGIFVTMDVNYWFESGQGKDVILRNNTIVGANKHLLREGAITVKCGHDSGGIDYPAGVHRNIKILNNTIRDTVNSGIYACSTDGIEIRGNTIEHASQKPSLANGNYAMYLKNCVKGVVKDNAVLFSDQVFGQENCKGIAVD